MTNRGAHDIGRIDWMRWKSVKHSYGLRPGPFYNTNLLKAVEPARPWLELSNHDAGLKYSVKYICLPTVTSPSEIPRI